MAQLELKDGPIPEDARSLIRVFLLSDDPLLREMLPAAFKRRPDILLVGTHPSSHGAAAEIVESACDVLLIDAANEADSFETQGVLADLKRAQAHLKFVALSMDRGIADLASSIHIRFAEGHATIESVHRTV